jgi:hypothetical protein
MDEEALVLEATAVAAAGGPAAAEKEDEEEGVRQFVRQLGSAVEVAGAVAGASCSLGVYSAAAACGLLLSLPWLLLWIAKEEGKDLLLPLPPLLSLLLLFITASTRDSNAAVTCIAQQYTKGMPSGAQSAASQDC